MRRAWPRKTILRKSTNVATSRDPAAPNVSVVIPTFNRATLLPRAIDSVLAQTFRDYELIIVDDCSTDNTADVVRAYANRGVRFVQLQKNAGVARALNEGIVAARGESVAFLGDDDEWLPALLDRLVERLQNDTPVSFAHSAVTWLLPSQVKIPRNSMTQPADLPEGDILRDLLKGTAQVCGSACLVRREVLLDFGGFDETLRRGEDTDLWLRMSVGGHRFGVVREPLALIHYDHDLGHLALDPILDAVSLLRFHRRWGPLASEHLGSEVYNRRHQRKLQRLRRKHRKLLKRLAREGDRGMAWRYARQMLPTLPWGAPCIARATAIAILGRVPHRLRRSAKKLRQRLSY